MRSSVRKARANRGPPRAYVNVLYSNQFNFKARMHGRQPVIGALHDNSVFYRARICRAWRGARGARGVRWKGCATLPQHFFNLQMFCDERTVHSRRRHAPADFDRVLCRTFFCGGYILEHVFTSFGGACVVSERVEAPGI